MALTQVASAATDTLLLDPDTARGGLIITNTDANRLYVRLGSNAATASAYSFYLETGETSDPIIGYGGEVRGIWAADGSGNANLTTWSR